MTENNTATLEPEVEESEVDEKSSETRLWENLQNNVDKFPQSLKIVRNEVEEEFVPTVYGRGDKKEAGLQYVGIKDKTTVDNLERRIKYIGVEKVCTIVQNFLTANAIASTERSVGDDAEDGVFSLELLVKGLQEFSSAGETTKELKEKLAEAQADFIVWSKETSSNPAVLAENHPKHKEYMSRMQDIADRMGYCQSNLAARIRGPRKKKTS